MAKRSTDYLGDSMREFEQSIRREDLLEYRYKQDLDFGMTDPKEWSLDDVDALEKIIHELHYREGEALVLYQPVPGAVDFHTTMAGEMGLVGPNRAGKSVAAAVECAMAASHCHQNKFKYPNNRGLEIAIVGPREEHLRLLYSTLFTSGKTFKVLFRDGQWVVPRWSCEQDVAMIDQWVDARPLIPERLVADTVWNRKAAGIPELVKLKNGTNIYFFSFEADPPRGVPFDICLSPDSELYDPVQKRAIRIGSQTEPFHVHSMNEKTGKIEIKIASAPFVKGYGEQLKVSLSNGSVILVAAGHRVLAADGEWVRIQDAYAGKIELNRPAFACRYRDNGIVSAQRRETSCNAGQFEQYCRNHSVPAAQSQASSEVHLHSTFEGCGDECVLQGLKEVRDFQFGCPKCSRSCGERSHIFEESCQCAAPLRDDAEDSIRSISASGGQDSKQGCNPSCLLSGCVSQDVCPCGSCEGSRQQPSSLAQQVPGNHQAPCLPVGSSSVCLRKAPLLSEDQVLGVSICRQQASSESQPHPTTFSAQASLCQSASLSTQDYGLRQGTVCGERRIQEMGETGSGAGSKTFPYGSPVEVNDTKPLHVTNVESLGQGVVYDISVEDNHNYIYGGIVNHNCWFDEESPRAKLWLTEMRMRMVSTRGRLIWSATPESATVTFFSLKSRAESPAQKDKPIYRQTKFFELYSRDNPFLDPEGLAAAIEKVSEDDPEMAAAKIDGEWAFRKFLVYPEFDENRHIIDAFQINWDDTVHLILDPSRTRLGMLWVAVVGPDSPHYIPHRPDRLIVFDELILKGANAWRCAQAVAQKMAFYKHWIQDITVDWTQGRKADEYDVTIADRYWEAFISAGIQSRFGQFVKGNSNLSYGIEEVSKALQPCPTFDDSKDNDPNFVIMRGKADTLVWEFKRYHRLRNPDGTPGRPTTKMNDLVDCARYAVCRGLQWVMPPSQTTNAQSYTQSELRALDRPGAMRELLFKHIYEPKSRQRRS